MSRYEHTQTATVILAVLVPSIAGTVGLLALAFPALPAPGRWIVAAVLFVLILAATAFRSMTVSVDEEEVNVRFGSGFIRRTIPLDEIESCEARRQTWLWGYGSRWIPAGWLWRVSGRDAVALDLQSGRTFLIGTDEPEALVEAIREAGG